MALHCQTLKTSKDRDPICVGEPYTLVNLALYLVSSCNKELPTVRSLAHM